MKKQKKFKSYIEVYDEWSGCDNAPDPMTWEEWTARGMSPEACRQACTVSEEGQKNSLAARVCDFLSDIEGDLAELGLEDAENLYEQACDVLWDIWNAQWAEDCKKALDARD